jgi:flagellar basal-body rod protein FlgG
MANGIYAAAAGMAAQQTRLDAIANDLANVDTTGYKSERVGFRDLVYGPENGMPVAIGAGAAAVDAGRTSAQGTLIASDNPLAVAISGPGYLQVRRADGTLALTRDGDLNIDATGALVAAGGEQLVPPVQLPKGTQPADVTIAANGTVSVAGRQVGAIQLVDVPAPSGLLSAGSSLFIASTASGAPVRAQGQLVQGQLEQSNVDAARAMTDLLDAQQSYSLASRAIQMQDQILEMANDLKHS